MKTKNDVKKNANYFTKTDTLKFIGIGLMILSGLLFLFGWGYVTYIIMSISLPAGFLCFILGSLSTVSEADIKAYIERQSKGTEKPFEDNPKLSKRLLKLPAPLSCEGFIFDGEIMLKKSKNGSMQSSNYAKAILYPLDTALFISYRKFSVISDELEQKCLEIPYSEITSIRLSESLKELSFNKKLFRVKDFTVIIERKNEEPISLPSQSDVQTENFISEINGLIEKAKNN